MKWHVKVMRKADDSVFLAIADEDGKWSMRLPKNDGDPFARMVFQRWQNKTRAQVAWDLQACAWIRACELAKACRPNEGETQATVAWWVFEKSYEHRERGLR